MQYYSKEIRIAFFSLVASLFLLSGLNPSFSQEELPEISDEDLELLEEFLELAEELFEEENYEESIFYYDKVLGIDPTDFDALFGMANSLENLGNYQASIIYYDLILEIDSSNVDALFGIAKALENLGKDEEAISYYNQAIEIEVEDVSFEEISDEDLDLIEEFLEQAEELLEEENYEEAISYYDKALAIDSTNAEALFGKSLVLESLGEEEESFSNLEKISIPEPPEVELGVLPEDTENPIVSDEIAKTDQTLFVIIGVFIVILIIIILFDYVARRRKTVSDVLTVRAPKQTIFSKPLSTSDSNQKEDDFHPTSLDAATNLEVNQAMKVLSNLREMNMLDDPKTAKQFLLMKGFSRISVKNALLGMGIDSSYVADL